MNKFARFVFCIFAGFCLQQNFSGESYAQERYFEPIAPIVPQRAVPAPAAPAPDAQNTAPAPSPATPTPTDNASVTDQPVCGVVHNQSPHRIYGDVSTDIAGVREGIEIRHNKTFRLNADERLEICSQGPFYEGRRLNFKLRSLFPLFECRTQIENRVIIIQSEKRNDGHGTRFFATCY